jgi:hypothetical protein
MTGNPHISSTETPDMAKNAVIRQEPEITMIDEVTSVLQIIERMTTNPAVDVDKLERLMDMHDKVIARRAKGAYLHAFSALQVDLPSIEERGIVKGNNGKVMYTYARWEDINDILKPILAKHGFGLWFKAGDQVEGGKTIVITLLGHRDGHVETTPVPMALDRSGAKNEQQGTGSSLSYAKKYGAGLLLNLTFRGEDDDAAAAGAHEKISEEQLADLLAKLEADKADLGKFESYLKVEKLSDLPAARFQEALDAMATRKAAVAKKATKVKA